MIARGSANAAGNVDGALGREHSYRISRLDIAIAVSLFVSALAYFSLSFARTIDLEDEGLILYHSARVAAGELPYRDFPDIYGPGVFWLTGLTLRAFDGSILAVRVLLAACKALAVMITFLIARPLAGRAFAVLGSLVALAYWGRLAWNLNTPFAALFTIPLCLLACFALIRALRADSAAAYAAAGLIGGAALLFKPSLGVVNALGMLLATSAVTALAAPPAECSRRGASQFLAVWGAGAAALVIPGWSFLAVSDYALHFLPLHVFMGLVAASAILHGARAPLAAPARRRLALLALGLASLPAAATATLVASGVELQDLYANLVSLPLIHKDPYIGIPLPPAGRTLMVVAVLALITSVLLALRGRWTGSLAVGLCAAAALAVASLLLPSEVLSTVGGRGPERPKGSEWSGVLRNTPKRLAGAESGAILLTASLALAPSLLAKRRRPDAAVLRTFVPLVMYQAMLIYQVFPRASINIWTIQGALAPLLAVVLSRWYRLGVRPGSGAPARIAAACLVSLVPLWMAAPVVRNLIRGIESRGDRRALAIPQAQGLALVPAGQRPTQMGDFERVVTLLRTADPPDAPVFLLTNEFMVLYLSGRPHLFPERDFYFYLLAWGLLPDSLRESVATESALRRLRETPQAVIVYRPDDAARTLLNELPGLREIMERDYAPWVEVGSYVVYRRKPISAG